MQVSIFTPLQGGGYFIKIGQSVITPNDIPNKRYEPALLFRIETPVFQRTIHKKAGLRRIRFLNLQRIIWVGIAFNIMLEQGLLSFCLVCGFFFFCFWVFWGTGGRIFSIRMNIFSGGKIIYSDLQSMQYILLSRTQESS